MKRVRDSKFELIRILSMIMIVVYHYNLYGNWKSIDRDITKLIFWPWGQIGVDLFVMISGYFLSTHNFEFEKIIMRDKKLWVKVLFYSYILLILSSIFKFSKLNLKEIIYSIFPVVSEQYWFITCYILLIIITPFLNWFIQSQNKRILLIYLAIFILFAEITPLLTNNGSLIIPLGTVFSTSNMAVSYLTASIIRKYHYKFNTLKTLLLAISGVILEYFSMFIQIKRGLGGNAITKFTFGFLPYLSAVGIFLLFVKCKSFYNKFINWIASGVLAAYLITEHPLFRLFFWQKLLNVGRFQNPTWLFIFMGIVIAVITVIVCAIVDHVYQFVFDKKNLSS